MKYVLLRIAMLPACAGFAPAARSIAMLPACAGFAPAARSIACAARGGPRRAALVARTPQYDDKMFGLVFLTGLLYAKDPIFTGTFGTLSLAAVFATFKGAVTQRQVDDGTLAAAVAISSCLIASGIALAMGEPPCITTPAEVVVCAVSVAFAASQTLQRQSKGQ